MSIPEFSVRHVSKQVYSMEEMPTFRRSVAFHWLFKFLRALSDAAIGTFEVPLEPPYQPFITGLLDLLDKIDALTDTVALAEKDSQRFGNKAFRTWHDTLVQDLPALCENFVSSHYKPMPGATLVPTPLPATTLPGQPDEVGAPNLATPSTHSLTASEASSLQSDTCRVRASTTAPGGVDSGDCAEDPHAIVYLTPDHLVGILVGYLSDAFGNRTRIDYGTGHELAFIAAICVLCRVGMAQPADLAVLSTVVVRRYIEVCRRFQSKYSLEPAGSHGSWGLDDFHIAPFVIGAAQHIIFANRPTVTKAGAPVFSRRAQREAAAAAAEGSGGVGVDANSTPSGVTDGDEAKEVEGGGGKGGAAGAEGEGGGGEKSRAVRDAVGDGEAREATQVSATAPSSVDAESSREAANLRALWDARQLDFSSVGDESTPVNLIQQPATCRELATRSLFFSMMDWIHSHKSGPFHEHSPTLFDISKLKSWVVVRRGLLRMFGEEVLNVHTIIQHFRFCAVLSMVPMPEYARVDIASPTADTDASSAAAYKHARAAYTNSRASVLSSALRGGAMGMAGLGGALGVHPAAMGITPELPGGVGGTPHPGALGGRGGGVGGPHGLGDALGVHPSMLGRGRGRGLGALSSVTAMPPNARPQH